MDTATTSPNLMAAKKKGDGPPPSAGPPKKTKHLRTKMDLVEKAGLVCEVTRRNVSDYVDPLLRPTIEADYERFKPQIEAMLRAREQARRKLGE